MIQVYKILNDIDIVEKKISYLQGLNILLPEVTPLNCTKKTRLNVRANTFSNRVVNTWNNLPDNVVMHPP